MEEWQGISEPKVSNSKNYQYMQPDNSIATKQHYTFPITTE